MRIAFLRPHAWHGYCYLLHPKGDDAMVIIVIVALLCQSMRVVRLSGQRIPHGKAGRAPPLIRHGTACGCAPRRIDLADSLPSA